MRNRLKPAAIALITATVSSFALTHAKQDSDQVDVEIASPIKKNLTSTLSPKLMTTSHYTIPQKLQEKTVEPKNTNPWADYPNRCETFTVYQGKYNRKTKRHSLHYRRNRFERSRKDRDRTRSLIRMVAREMGAEPELLLAIAHHESSWNPEAIHILNRDQEANRQAWEKFSYSERRENDLREQLRQTNATNADYWHLRRALSKVQIYKGNPYWNTKLQYDYVVPERTLDDGSEAPEARITEWQSVWSYGYGLYGMNSILYTRILDSTAPPWVLCADEGIVATVTAIWALRAQQAECASLSQSNPVKYGTEGGSYKGVLRRFAKGQCGKGELGSSWLRVMEKHDIDWDASAQLGQRFPQYEMVRKGKRLRFAKDDEGEKIRTDPMEVIEHMKTRAEELDLLRPEPLKRKNPDTAPIVASR
jgi:hypothetical protein